ncbi:MAG: T9SS type A sorting domain-containing protein [Candidatus Cloacimonadota bacterium]|nr:T9SS type A sorting domain-containing protein [Candidatus Cloacimonadota bacterium]
MKHKTFALLFILLLFSELNGNVVFPGAYIEEIYFDGDYWTIELLNIFVQEETLDNCKIASSSDTSLFNPGIYFPLFGYTLITQDSLQSQLNINKNGDMIATYYPYNDLVDRRYFGDYINSIINSPFSGQSLARITISDTATGMSGKVLTKDNSPTLGIPNDTTGTQGTFCGYVFDNQNNPIIGTEIQFYRQYNVQNLFPIINTNSYGYFSQRMFSLNYDVFILVDGSVLMDTTITIEPDSTTYCEFYIDLTSVDEEIKKYNQIILNNYPNPFIESTTISFSATSLLRQLADTPGQAKINIYNIKGQLVKQLSIDNRQSSIEWDGKSEEGILQPPGFYFYSLEIDGKKVKTNKMIMVR